MVQFLAPETYVMGERSYIDKGQGSRDAIEIPWGYLGDTMGIPLGYHGDTMGIPWGNHGVTMEIPWRYHVD
jgi:hypothetical protein